MVRSLELEFKSCWVGFKKIIWNWKLSVSSFAEKFEITVWLRMLHHGILVELHHCQ